jgi:AraC family transcriptional regulator
MPPSYDEILEHEYLLRLNRVIDYIQNHYAEDLNLKKLAEVACFSRYHFHRVFRALVGETVNEFVRRVRLERAVNKLILDKYKSITEIALDCGFSSSQNFARCFKAYYGATPSLVREQFNWDSWKIKMRNFEKDDGQELPSDSVDLINHYRTQRHLSIENILAGRKTMQVRITDMPSYRVAYVRRRGRSSNWETTHGVFTRLLQWASDRGLINKETLAMGVIWGNPDITPEDKLIYDACITVPESIKADRWVNIQSLPGGKFAIHHCEIEVNGHDEAWMSLILNWLASSDYQPDDRPGYEIYYNDAETHALKHQILDLCLPIRPLYV